MGEKSIGVLKVFIAAVLVFQLAGCGTLLYPDRRGQVGGRLDVGVTILDAVGLLFFIIPGVIAFAVDFSDGCIYLPAPRPLIVPAGRQVYLRQIRFDPKHTSLAQIERIIKDQTGYEIKLTQADMRVIRLRSHHEMMERFAQSAAEIRQERIAFNVHQSCKSRFDPF